MSVKEQLAGFDVVRAEEGIKRAVICLMAATSCARSSSDSALIVMTTDVSAPAEEDTKQSPCRWMDLSNLTGHCPTTSSGSSLEISFSTSVRQ
jgi:hypothetical protein